MLQFRLSTIFLGIAALSATAALLRGNVVEFQHVRQRPGAHLFALVGVLHKYEVIWAAVVIACIIAACTIQSGSIRIVLCGVAVCAGAAWCANVLVSIGVL
jgi:hypothetical protein